MPNYGNYFSNGSVLPSSQTVGSAGGGVPPAPSPSPSSPPPSNINPSPNGGVLSGFGNGGSSYFGGFSNGVAGGIPGGSATPGGSVNTASVPFLNVVKDNYWIFILLILFLVFRKK